MKHVLSIDQFEASDLLDLFALTEEIRNDPGRFRSRLQGQVVATLFYEPSTRTRLSFEAAIQRLGGSIISTENAKELSSAIKGETLRDTIRVVQGYADAIVLRHYEDDAADEAVEVAKVPVINAGSGAKEHPTQALLDLYTIYTAKGRLDDLKYVVAGDLLYGRTVHSLVKKLAPFRGVTIYGLSRPEFALPQEYVTLLEEQGVRYIACQSFSDVPENVDVIYHTRTQLERMPKQQSEVKELIINQETLDRFSPKTILLHPLPRNREIAQEIDQDPRAYYFRQSENGMYVRMALLISLLAEKKS